MNQNNGRSNGKWKLAFWIMTFFIVGFGGFVTTTLIGNDRIRASEDQRIEGKIEANQKVLNTKLTEILVAIGRLEENMNRGRR